MTENDPQQIRLWAQSLYNEGRYEEALELLEPLGDSDPAVVYAIAQCHARMGNTAAAHTLGQMLRARGEVLGNTILEEIRDVTAETPAPGGNLKTVSVFLAAMVVVLCVAALFLLGDEDKPIAQQPAPATHVVASVNKEPRSQASVEIPRLSSREPDLVSARVFEEVLASEEAYLVETLGAGQFANAKAALLTWSRSTDEECQAALRIIADTTPRLQREPISLNVDGHPEDWEALDTSPRDGIPREVRRFWPGGIATTIQDGRLYLLAGLDPKSSLKEPLDGIEVSVDLFGDLGWDTRLRFMKTRNEWELRRSDWTQFASEADPVSPDVFAVSVDKTLEASIDLEAMTLGRKAKSVVHLQLAYVCGTGDCRPRTSHTFTLDNQETPPGGNASPYIHVLAMLAADTGLEKDDRIAPAIAIASAFLYRDGTSELKLHLRRDNAAFLKLGRSIADWQEQENLSTKLREYPIEATLAWADRFHLEMNPQCYWGTSIKDKAAHSFEGYRWSALSPDTTKALRQIALTHDLPSSDADKMAFAVEDWASTYSTRATLPGWIADNRARHGYSPTSPALQPIIDARNRGAIDQSVKQIGTYRGETVMEKDIIQTEAMLRGIREHGRVIGGLDAHLVLVSDMYRALGMAPLYCGSSRTRYNSIGSAWVGYYHPTRKIWRAIYTQYGEPLRTFYIHRPTVHTSGLDLPLVHPHENRKKFVYPKVYRSDMSGDAIRAMSLEGGIPTESIREWILTPGPHFESIEKRSR